MQGTIRAEVYVDKEEACISLDLQQNQFRSFFKQVGFIACSFSVLEAIIEPFS